MDKKARVKAKQKTNSKNQNEGFLGNENGFQNIKHKVVKQEEC